MNLTALQLPRLRPLNRLELCEGVLIPTSGLHIARTTDAPYSISQSQDDFSD